MAVQDSSLVDTFLLRETHGTLIWNEVERRN